MEPFQPLVEFSHCRDFAQSCDSLLEFHLESHQCLYRWEIPHLHFQAFPTWRQRSHCLFYVG